MSAEDLLGLGSNDLLGFNQSVQQSDPYGIAGRSLAGWQPNTSTWSPMETGMGAFAKSFFSGLLGNYAQQRSADQLNSVISVLPQLKSDPMSVVAPKGVNADAFALLKGTALVKNQLQSAQRDQTLAELMQKVGAFSPGELAQFGTAGIEKMRSIQGENAAYGVGQGAKNPKSPDYQVDQDLFKIEQAYTDKLLTGAQAQAAVGINKAGLNILEAIKKDNPLAASTAIFEFAKLQDPTGTVREGDEMRVSDPGGPLGQLSQIYNTIQAKGKLTEEAKGAMRDLVPVLQKNTFDQYNSLRDSYIEAAGEYGANPKRIKYIKQADYSSYLNPPTDPSAATMPPGLDQNTLLEEALALKAANPSITQGEIAATLRQKYSGATQMRLSPSGVPLG